LTGSYYIGIDVFNLMQSVLKGSIGIHVGLELQGLRACGEFYFNHMPNKSPQGPLRM